jgi:clan AA aspartic protease
MTPTVALEVRGSRGSMRITAIIDTGFDGYVCLPTSFAVQLGLELVSQGSVELADGTVKTELLFAGSVGFLGGTRPVQIYLTDSEDALIGTSLLADCRLLIDFRAGSVRLSRKPPRRGKRQSE